MQEINAWLQNGLDYKTGAALYIKYGNNTFLKRLLEADPTPYTTEKLEAELRKMAPELNVIADKPKLEIKQHAPAPSEQVEPVKTPDQCKSNTEDLKRYLQIKEDQKTLYRQLERNMTELDMSKNEPFLLLTAKNILSLHGKIRDRYKLIDYFDLNGEFPDLKAKIQRTPAEEIQLLRVSIYKAKIRLQSPGCRDIEQTKKLITESQNRIIALGGKIKS
ncbi:hypothetical protein DBR40_24745 [Pedobacter sp. KBW01]|uniref:hypothetical protein n=1 Tax=Pedobacter sp. KBW01 TaxID=2153364 RepID=UPI000F5AD0F1|nr:hypothetical protein [Pedobacter sp. KBW01]RQO65083.1 hypothetical protein DBR40_24745 [Pedobacter sp. KBW01]